MQGSDRLYLSNLGMHVEVTHSIQICTSHQRIGFLCLPPILESYLPSTPFEKRKTFLCAICISICWHWRHGKWIIGLMGNVGERGIEKDREKAAWKKKKKQPLLDVFFSSPPPPLFISPSTSQPLVLLKRFTLASHFHSFCTTPSPSLSLVCTRTL